LSIINFSSSAGIVLNPILLTDIPDFKNCSLRNHILAGRQLKKANNNSQRNLFLIFSLLKNNRAIAIVRINAAPEYLVKKASPEHSADRKINNIFFVLKKLKIISNASNTSKIKRGSDQTI